MPCPACGPPQASSRGVSSRRIFNVTFNTNGTYRYTNPYSTEAGLSAATRTGTEAAEAGWVRSREFHCNQITTCDTCLLYDVCTWCLQVS